MLVAWLGFVRPLVLAKPIRAAGVTGPDPLTSTAYAAEYNEVRVTDRPWQPRLDRTPGQTDTALFFNSNSAIMVSEAYCGTWTPGLGAFRTPHDCSR